MTQRFLVTGGAGFLGSHLVDQLVRRGDDIVIIDNLSQGHAESVPPGARLIVGDVGDAGLVGSVLANGPWDGVFHFAALSIVADSKGWAIPCWR